MEYSYLIQAGVAVVAAIIHIYIFFLESFLWSRPKTRKVFGVSEADAVVTQSLAFNQGFYNLFLSLAILIGLYLSKSGGAILVEYAMASIGAAGVVLFVSRPKMWRGAAIQFIPAAIYFTFLLFLK